MIPYRNARGMIALRVMDTLYLPNGNAVPWGSVTGWEESEDDPESAESACYAAAGQGQIRAEACAAPPATPAKRTLPVLDAPKPFRENPDTQAFIQDCYELRDRIAQIRVGKHRIVLDTLDRLMYEARIHDVSPGMHALYDSISGAYDPEEIQKVTVEFQEIREWAPTSGMPQAEIDYVLRCCLFLETGMTIPHVTQKMRHLLARLRAIRRRWAARSQGSGVQTAAEILPLVQDGPLPGE